MSMSGPVTPSVEKCEEDTTTSTTIKPDTSCKFLLYLEDDENQTIANFCHTQCFIIADSSVTFGLYQETNQSTLTKSGFLLYKFLCFYEKKIKQIDSCRKSKKSSFMLKGFKEAEAW